MSENVVKAEAGIISHVLEKQGAENSIKRVLERARERHKPGQAINLNSEEKYRIEQYRQIIQQEESKIAELLENATPEERIAYYTSEKEHKKIEIKRMQSEVYSQREQVEADKKSFWPWKKMGLENKMLELTRLEENADYYIPLRQSDIKELDMKIRAAKKAMGGPDLSTNPPAAENGMDGPQDMGYSL